MLVCARCHALVHATELSRLSEEARAFESLEHYSAARGCWTSALSLLPSDAAQAEWVRNHLRDIEPLPDVPQATTKPEHPWVRKFGPLAPIAILAVKGKSLLALFKINFLFSLFAFMGFYWTLYGASFGIGFAILILLHEMGHFVDIKRRGLPADMPVFLPGFGAYVRWQALGVSAETKAAVSLAGPFSGGLASLLCAAVWVGTGNALWAALAHAGAWLNLLNLVPIWVLDGGQAVRAVNKTGRIVLLSACLLLWVTLHQSVLFLIALGAGYQLFFSKDAPERSTANTTAYFVALITGLTVLMWMLPTKP